MTVCNGIFTCGGGVDFFVALAIILGLSLTVRAVNFKRASLFVFPILLIAFLLVAEILFEIATLERGWWSVLTYLYAAAGFWLLSTEKIEWKKSYAFGIWITVILFIVAVFFLYAAFFSSPIKY